MQGAPVGDGAGLHEERADYEFMESVLSFLAPERDDQVFPLLDPFDESPRFNPAGITGFTSGTCSR
jgi:hypothetical protein